MNLRTTDRVHLKDYMLLPLEKRQEHLNLDTPCLEIGGGSKEARALLAVTLNTTCHYLGKANGYLCHACHNGGCSNPSHLYWGTPKENSADFFRVNPDHGKKNAKITVERYGKDHYRRIGALGNAARTVVPSLPKEEVERRITLIKESEVDLTKWGWVQKVGEVLGLTHHGTKVFIDKYYPYEVYRRSSPSRK